MKAEDIQTVQHRLSVLYGLKTDMENVDNGYINVTIDGRYVRDDLTELEFDSIKAVLLASVKRRIDGLIAELAGLGVTVD